MERDFKAWHGGDTTGRIGSGESEFIGEELRGTFKSMVRALALVRG
ncbi:MAG: hypothetical protein M3R26_03120 [Actinomycetota bacterium]|nr:hypothetical protein [Actinomycetota bacterium]MDQ2981300.1 hypothetical protein [Actinomycetota bacterium]